MSTETVCYLRLQLLNVEGGTPVLREIFEDEVKRSFANGNKKTYLTFFEDHIKSLKKNRIISPAAYKVVFPENGHPTDIEQWDVSLLSGILLNCCSLFGVFNDLKYILKAEVQSQKHNCLDSFLLNHKDAIDKLRKSEITDEQYHRLFPLSQEPTNLIEWDRATLLCILIKLCTPKTILKTLTKLREAVKRAMEISDLNTFTIDSFLKKHLKKLEDLNNSKAITPSQYKLLFPDDGVISDVYNWDNDLLCTIVLNVCEPLSLPVIEAIETIRTSRNEMMAHKGMAAIDHDVFLKKWSVLLRAICDLFTTVPHLKKTVTTAINKFSSGPLDIQSSVDVLTKWYMKDQEEHAITLDTLQAIKTSIGDKIHQSETNVKKHINDANKTTESNICQHLDEKMQECINTIKTMWRENPDNRSSKTIQAYGELSMNNLDEPSPAPPSRYDSPKSISSLNQDEEKVSNLDSSIVKPEMVKHSLEEEDLTARKARQSANKQLTEVSGTELSTTSSTSKKVGLFPATIAERRKVIAKVFTSEEEDERRKRTAEAERRKKLEEVSARFEGIDGAMIETYIKTLNEGTEKHTSFRLMIVGHYGVGKTTIAKKLMNSSLERRESTNGIDIHVHKCMAKDTSKWKLTKQRDPAIEQCERMMNITKNMKLHDIEPKPAKKLFTRTGTKDINDWARTKQLSDLKVIDDIPTTLDKDVKMFAQKMKNKSTFKFRKEPSKSKGKTKSINIWDFGDQFEFYATHQLFYSQDAVYLLVLDISKKFDDMVVDTDFPETSSKRNVESFCKFWMHSIHSFVGGPGGSPPVILIGTHTDLLTVDKLRKKEIANAYFRRFRDLFSGTEIEKHLVCNDFVIDNKSKQDDLMRLREYIIEVADGKVKEMPARWISFERSLSERTSQKHVAFEEVSQLANAHGITQKNDLIECLRCFHSQGTCVYFNEPVLSECVVLNPQWITDAFKCVVTHERFRKPNTVLRQEYEDLKTKAILHDRLIDDVWKDEQADFMENKQLLIQFMTKCGIIAKAKLFEEETGQVRDLDFFLIPSLLRNSSTGTGVNAFISKHRSTKTFLVFTFKNDSIAPTLYNRVTAAALHMWPVVQWPVVKGKENILLFEDIGIYKMDISHAGMIYATDQTIEIRVLKLCGKGDDNKQNDRLRRFIEMILKHEFGRFQSADTQYEIGIRCAVEYEGSKNVYQMNKLEGKTTVPCPDLNHDIDVNTVLQEWYTDYVNGAEQAYTLESYEEDKLARKVTEKDIPRIAMAIGCNWELLAYSLGVSHATCDRIKLEYPNMTVQQIDRMLLKWSETCENATFQTLLHHLDETKDVTVNRDLIKNILDSFEW